MKHIKNSIVFILFFLPFIVFAQVEDLSLEELERTESGFQVGENNEIRIQAWNISDFGAFSNKIDLDTLKENFHQFHPLYKNSITNSFTGNYGGSYLNNDFFLRNYRNDFFFLNTHDEYLLTPLNIVYYNTTTPYTVLDYSQSESRNIKNETRFNVLHSQNINQKLNFTFRFDQARSDGQYDQQANKNNFITLYSNYLSDELDFYAGFILNKIVNGENGGIVSDDLLLDVDASEYIDVNLENVSNEYRSNYFFINAEYKLGVFSSNEEGTEIFNPKIGLLYSLETSYNLKNFKEETVNSDFFQQTFLDSLVTKDSVRYNRISNIIQVKFYENNEKKFTFGKRAFVGFDLVKAVYPKTQYDYDYHTKYTNSFIGAGIFRKEGEFWNWNAEGKIFLTGYKLGQTELSASIWKPLTFMKDSLALISIEGKIENLVPDFFQQNFSSNHFKWKNNFVNIQQMIAGLKLEMPNRQFKTGFNYALINNYIYNNINAMPAQADKKLLILSGYIDKSFLFKNFNIRTKLLTQKASSEQFIHLPVFSALLSISYHTYISKVMYAQFGIDTRYNTAYYADAYEPSIGLFYLQNEKKLGNYPYIDAYVTLKLKRTKVFFQYMNLGTEFINKEYFTVYHYPMNRRTFRLGVNWSFYD